MAKKKGLSSYEKELRLLKFMQSIKPTKKGGKARTRTMVKPHYNVTMKCKLCGEYHTVHQHRSHGPGAFARVHSSKKRR